MGFFSFSLTPEWTRRRGAPARNPENGTSFVARHVKNGSKNCAVVLQEGRLVQSAAPDPNPVTEPREGGRGGARTREPATYRPKMAAALLVLSLCVGSARATVQTVGFEAAFQGELVVRAPPGLVCDCGSSLVKLLDGASGHQGGSTGRCRTTSARAARLVPFLNSRLTCIAVVTLLRSIEVGRTDGGARKC